MKTKITLKIGVLLLCLSFFSFKTGNSNPLQNNGDCLSADTVSQRNMNYSCSQNYVPVVNAYLVANGYTVYNINMPDCDNAYCQTAKDSVNYTTHVFLSAGIVTGHVDNPR